MRDANAHSQRSRVAISVVKWVDVFVEGETNFVYGGHRDCAT
jgi:hypothetical protein